jgi:hypothetical protein
MTIMGGQTKTKGNSRDEITYISFEVSHYEAEWLYSRSSNIRHVTISK